MRTGRFSAGSVRSVAPLFPFRTDSGESREDPTNLSPSWDTQQVAHFLQRGYPFTGRG
jgi:hypothetical protein